MSLFLAVSFIYTFNPRGHFIFCLYFAEGMCTPLRVSISPLFSNRICDGEDKRYGQDDKGDRLSGFAEE